MKQVIQSARTGKLAVKDVPRPAIAPGDLLVATTASLISAGTERMVVDFARKNLASKARARPDLVKKVLNKAKTDGWAATIRSVRARLDEPLPLGYSAAGSIVELGDGLDGAFRVGDRVAIAGAGIANHAEFNAVPRNLAVTIPDNVGDEEASFATLGAIALHAVRNTGATLGETVAVVGAGLVGQLALQFLRLSGVRAVALDYDSQRLYLAQTLGAEAVYNLNDWTAERIATDIADANNGIGCDAILIAAASSSAEPFETTAEIARDRARVCVVGMTGTDFPYAAYMKKELNIVVSRSYGPGRYDDDYEERGVAYPTGYIRWTETANMAETLRLMAKPAGQCLDVKPLITHHYAIENAETAYELVTGGSEPHLGVIMNYGTIDDVASPEEKPRPVPTAAGKCCLGVIGAGNFARTVLLPELAKFREVELRTVSAKSGASADYAKEKFGFDQAVSDSAEIIADPSINAVLIATRHDTHAALAAQALSAGKAVWVEKPLALSNAEIGKVEEAHQLSPSILQIGYNRRFAPATLAVLAKLNQLSGPRNIMMRINAGRLPKDHWTLHPTEGGGRLVGEGCHFIDLARQLGGSPISAIRALSMGQSDPSIDDVTVSIQFSNGGLATIVYSSLGDAGYAKEQIEVFAGGQVFAIDNFRTWTITANGVSEKKGGSQDKGHAGALQAFATAVATGGAAPIEAAELFETSRAAIAAQQSLLSGEPIEL